MCFMLILMLWAKIGILPVMQNGHLLQLWMIYGGFARISVNSADAGNSPDGKELWRNLTSLCGNAN